MRVPYRTELDSTMPNKTKPPTQRRGTIQSVDRAARILKLLAGGPRRLGVTELAQRLDLAAPTVHGLLQTLQAHGFVEQDRDSGKYQLGAGLLQLGNSYLDLNELRARSIVHADRLAARADAAVRVGVLHGPSVIVVHHVFRPDATLQIPEVGAELPAHATALGKAILAWAPEGDARRPAGRGPAEAHRPDAHAGGAQDRAPRDPRGRRRAREGRGHPRRGQPRRADLRPRRPRRRRDRDRRRHRAPAPPRPGEGPRRGGHGGRPRCVAGARRPTLVGDAVAATY